MLLPPKLNTVESTKVTVLSRGDRTDDLFHAMEARSQVRHRPTIEDKNSRARQIGIEGKCSIHFRPHYRDSQRAPAFVAKPPRFARRDGRGGCPYMSLGASHMSLGASHMSISAN